MPLSKLMIRDIRRASDGKALPPHKLQRLVRTGAVQVRGHGKQRTCHLTALGRKVSGRSGA